MPNPSGYNQFGGFGTAPPYGDVKRQQTLTQAAPISGAPQAAEATNAPRRAQRHATGQDSPQGQNPQEPVVLPEPPPPVSLSLDVWSQLAQDPGASPLTRMYAQMAIDGA